MGLPLLWPTKLRCLSTAFTVLILFTLHILILASPAQCSLNFCLMHAQRHRWLHQVLVEQGGFSGWGQVQVTTQTIPAGEVGLLDLCRTPRCCVAPHEHAIDIFAVAIHSQQLTIARNSRVPCSRLAVIGA